MSSEIEPNTCACAMLFVFVLVFGKMAHDPIRIRRTASLLKYDHDVRLSAHRMTLSEFRLLVAIEITWKTNYKGPVKDE